ncbi:MAG: hypothetical protein K2X39_01550, partial [Silvanigrellaceae bacterium]|nr:hypothetical protein [Silvanigrellaceae bacterium]
YLKEHHISVYINQKDNNPALSQYHYTASFRDDEDTPYILHTYFNENDVPTAPPSFMMETENGSLKKIDSSELEEVFLNLTRSHTQPVLKDLRLRHQQKNEALEKKIFELEKTRTDAIAKADSSATQKSSEELIEVLKLASFLVKHSHYEGQHKYLLNIKNAFNQVSIRHKKNVIKEASLVAQPMPSTFQNMNFFSESLIKSNNSSKKKKSPGTNLLSEINGLIERINNLDIKNFEIYTEEIIAMNATFLEITLLFSMKGLSHEILKKIDNTGSQIAQLGNTLLFSLINEDRLDLAAKLTKFHYLLNLGQLGNALENLNAPLLNFLLTYGDYAVNNQSLSVKGKTYPTAIHYCVAVHDPQKTNTECCLNILMQHGASLLLEGKNGLPLAHTILSTKNHPLMPVLQANRKLTLQNRAFYRQLIAALTQYLQRPNLDENKKIVLSQAIERYQQDGKRQLIAPDMDGKRGDQIRELVDNSRILFDKITNLEHSNNPKNIINNNPRVIELKALLSKENISFRNKLTTKQLRREKINIYEQFKSQLESTPESAIFDYQPIEFNLVMVILTYEDNIEVLRKESRLIDIDNDLSVPSISRKDWRQLKKEAAQLRQELSLCKNASLFDLRYKQLFLQFGLFDGLDLPAEYRQILEESSEKIRIQQIIAENNLLDTFKPSLKLLEIAKELVSSKNLWGNVNPVTRKQIEMTESTISEGIDEGARFSI